MNTRAPAEFAISPELRSHYLDPQAMSWEPTDVPGISAKILFKDNAGMSTIMFKLESGAVVPFHEHAGVEQTYVLEGSLEDHEGRALAGNFVWRPAGNMHEAHAPNGAVILCFFTKPNRFRSGMEFYTEQRR